MPALAVSADGESIFVALEDSSTGNQIVFKAARSNLSAWTVAYDPGGGAAANVAQVPGNEDEMLFYGNFGTDIQVVKHTISSSTNTNVSPASLGARVVNSLAVNPSDGDEFVITIDTDADLEHTDDNGATYTEWNAALGFDATALWVLWSGDYFPHRAFTAGEFAVGNLDLLYTPNEGANLSNEENAALAAQAAICSVEATES